MQKIQDQCTVFKKYSFESSGGLVSNRNEKRARIESFIL
jgi:hypothetical protein